MIGNVLSAGNLDKAARDVMRNKGSSGIDGMKTTEQGKMPNHPAVTSQMVTSAH